MAQSHVLAQQYGDHLRFGSHVYSVMPTIKLLWQLCIILHQQFHQMLADVGSAGRKREYFGQ